MSTTSLLSQINPLRARQLYFVNILYSNILWSGFPKWVPSFWFIHQNPLCIFLLSHTCHMPCPSRPPWYDNPNDVRWAVQIMKLLIVQFSAVSFYLLSGPHTFPNTLFLNTLSPWFSLSMPDDASQTHEQDAQYTYHVTLRRVRTAIDAVENKYYIVWVCVCSLSYPAYSAPYCVVICCLSGFTKFFPSYLIKGRFFEK